MNHLLMQDIKELLGTLQEKPTFGNFFNINQVAQEGEGSRVAIVSEAFKNKVINPA